MFQRAGLSLATKEEKQDVVKPVEVKEVENPVTADSVEVATEKAEDTPAAAAVESTEVAPAPPAEESTKAFSETAPATAKESSGTTEEEKSGDQEAAEKPEIKLETAPADFWFPTTNQTRHCFTRYIEYHRCVAAKGEMLQSVISFKNITVLCALANGMLDALLAGENIQEEATAIKAADKARFNTMISDSDCTEFENFSKWPGVSQ